MSNTSTTLKPLTIGQRLPEIFIFDGNGKLSPLASVSTDHNWKLILLHRGMRCQVCRLYLEQWGKHSEMLKEQAIELIAVSSDPREQIGHEDLPVIEGMQWGFGLNKKHIKSLGANTFFDRKTKITQAEPATILINTQGQVVMYNHSSSPFAQPNINLLLSGIRWLNMTEDIHPSPKSENPSPYPETKTAIQ